MAFGFDPSAVNIMGAFDQGQQQARNMEQQKLLGGIRGQLQQGQNVDPAQLQQLATFNPQQAAVLKNMFGDMKNEQIADAFMTAPIAFSLSGEERNQFLRNKLKEIPANSPFRPQIAGLIGKSETEQNEALLSFTALGQSMGVLPKDKEEKGTNFQSGATREFIGPDGQRTLGSTRFNPKTGEMETVLASTPEGFQLAGETAQQKVDLKVQEAERKEQAKQLETQRAEIRKTIVANGLAANRNKSKLIRIREGLEAVKTGKMAEAKRLLGPYIPNVDPSSEQAMQAILNTQVFPILANFAGAISDRETLFAKETVAGLGNTPAANAMILDSMLRTIDDSIEERDQFRKFTKQGGKAENFLFEPSDLTGQINIPQATPQQATPQQATQQGVNSPALGRMVSEQEISEIMQKTGLTRDAVLQRLGVQ